MLINYTFGNYRSFRDKATLSMKATAQTTFNDNLIREFKERILPSAVIYGANASGKSNIISSLSVLRNIVIAGSISNNVKELTELELYPFAHDETAKPISFCVEFTTADLHMIYELDINVDIFRKGARTISFEQLSVVKNKKTMVLFTRTNESIVITKNKKVYDFLNVTEEFVKDIEQKLNDNLDPVDLFLCRGFKSIICAETAEKVIEFFASKLYVVTDFTLKSTSLTITSDESFKSKNFSIWNDLLESFVKSADFGPQSIRFKSKNINDEHSADMELYSIYTNGNREAHIPAQLMESRGTLKLVDFAMAFQTFFKAGGVFVIDEFDAALHPELVKSIISLFNNQSFNQYGAQLIFTTHNPIYLNNRMFRRDQIIFVEKDKTSYRSAMYSLADFGSVDVRNDENFLINYFKGKYSSLPYIDFSELITEKEG